MEFAMEDAVTLLGRTPAALRALLDGLPEAWTAARDGDDTWSAYDVVGHLIHGERTDWLGRARTILAHGERVPFAPFDRFAQFRDSEGKLLSDLLAEFAALRADNLAAIRDLVDAERDLDRTGVHPDFGVVTLRQLLATWVVHDLNHLVQVARTLAKQYDGVVGPWEAYLPVLRDRARGA